MLPVEFDPDVVKARRAIQLHLDSCKRCHLLKKFCYVGDKVVTEWRRIRNERKNSSK